MTYLGYPNTTGLKTIDYRITDQNHDPPGMSERYHGEQLLRLDPCCWCYQPDDEGPEVAEVPALKSGGITFGSLNRFVKVTDRMMMLWAEILRQVPNSKLLILVPHGSANDGPMLRQLERGGLPMERVTPIARTTRLSYLDQFNSIDIALDTFPYNGHTTTCDALWMGVPVVSLAGNTHVSRAGVSVLSNVGLSELVAESPEQYVAIAASLAGDFSRLELFRKELRHRMLRSPLLDAKGFTARLENSFCAIWKRWCEGEQAGASI